MARELGVRQATVSAWERGIESPRAQHFPRFSAVLGVSDLMPQTDDNLVRLGRMRAGLTTTQAAAAAGIGQGAWNRIERGLGRTPTPAVVAQIAAALDVPVEDVSCLV